MQYSRVRRYSKSSSNKFKRAISVDNILKAVIFLLLFYTGASLLFGDKNVFSYMKKIKEEATLKKEIQKLQEQQYSLLEKKRYLEKDMFYVEKRAREDLGLQKEDEDIYILVENKEKDDNIADKTQRWINRIIKAYTDR